VSREVATLTTLKRGIAVKISLEGVPTHALRLERLAEEIAKGIAELSTQGHLWALIRSQPLTRWVA
jgi:hypothetical protein